MPTTFALSWNRSPDWAALLGKPPGRAVSRYPSSKYSDVETTAAHINSLDPEMDCGIEVYKT